MKHTVIMCMALSFLIGVATVIQGGVNITLAVWSGDALRSTCIQFIIGTICLSPFLCHNTGNTILLNIVTECTQNRKNYFVFLNGCLGVVFICSAIYATPVIGFGLYIISVIIGQILTSTLIDEYGLIWSEQRKLSYINIVGTLLTVCGEIVFQMESIKNSNTILISILCVTFSIFAGICVTIQAALNRHLQVIIDDTSYKSSFISFMNGSLILIMVNIIMYSIKGDWFIVHQTHFKWYMFFGGILGAFVVTMFIICPSYIGFVTTYICSIFGSMVTSVLFDYFGTFGVNVMQKQISIWKVIGIVIVLIGAILVNIRTPKYKNPNTSNSLIEYSIELDVLNSGILRTPTTSEPSMQITTKE